MGEDARETRGACDSRGAWGALRGAPDRRARAATQGVDGYRRAKSETKPLAKRTGMPDKKTGFFLQKQNKQSDRSA